jgi:hypothetical protein
MVRGIVGAIGKRDSSESDTEAETKGLKHRETGGQRERQRGKKETAEET